MMSIETTLTYWAVFSLWFTQVGRGMPHTAQWCSVRHLVETTKVPIRVWKAVVECIPSILFCSSGFIEEVADQTGLELLSMPRQLSILSHVTSPFT